MARTLARQAAVVALFKALRAAKGGPPLGTRLAALPRMIVAAFRGEYDGRGRVGLMALATAYIIWPFDFLPEAILTFPGLIDDAFVLTWLAGAILSETERFLTWERHRRPGVGRFVADGR